MDNDVFDELHHYTQINAFDFIPEVDVDPHQLRIDLENQLQVISDKLIQFSEEDDDTANEDQGFASMFN